MKNKLFTKIAILLLIALLAVILLSWLWSAAMPQSPIRSLLSSEGVRWTMGKMMSNEANQLLVSLLMLSAAWGVMSESKITKIRDNNIEPRQRRHDAWIAVAIEIAITIGLMALLAFSPHAILLNVTGDLFPSTFSSSLVPLIAILVILCSATYGLMTRTFTTSVDVFSAAADGLRQASPLVLLLMIAVQLYCSVCFVFSN